MKLLKKRLYLLLIITFIPLLNVYAESGGYIVKFKDCYSPPNGICDFKLISKGTNL